MIMKKTLLVFVTCLMCCVAFGSLCATGTPCKVVTIKDGDTVVVFDGQRLITIRIAGIDAPELNQIHGLEAKTYLSNLLEGRIVEIEGATEDKYGRTVATIRTSNGVDISEVMVEEGYAWHYKKYSDSERLAKLEQEAKAAGKGLWAGEIIIAPWSYRKNPEVTQIAKESDGSGESENERRGYIPRRPISSYSSGGYTSGASSVSYSGGSSPKKPLDQSKPVKVRGYYRKDGTYVRPHTRNPPRR